MTPRRTRQALCAFLLLAVAVHYNALFRQVRPTLGGSIAAEPPLALPGQPRPKAASSVVAERPAAGKDVPDKRAMRVARANPAPHQAPHQAPDQASDQAPHQDWVTTESTGVAAAAQKSDAAGPDTIRAIQRELRQKGYGNLASDGTLRPQTRAAIMAYEYDNGLVLTGQASEGLLTRILFGGSPVAEPAGKVGSAEAAELVRLVQQSLAALGYQPGPADGQLKAETVRAIREFEMDKGLVPKGRVSAELMAQLAAPASPKLSRR
jgi:peptidoglycan hydrolase-like protein with peptidoglycan-binding domain